MKKNLDSCLQSIYTSFYHHAYYILCNSVLEMLRISDEIYHHTESEYFRFTMTFFLRMRGKVMSKKQNVNLSKIMWQGECEFGQLDISKLNGLSSFHARILRKHSLLFTELRSRTTTLKDKKVGYLHIIALAIRGL